MHFTMEMIKDSFTHSSREPRRSLSIDGYRRAGVLVPLISTGDVVEVLLTKRTETVESHKGQISFPGGMVDPDDRDIQATALRELTEETGIAQKHVELLGMLDDLPVPTGFVITPVVGAILGSPEMLPNLDEVADVFHVPLNYFADDAHGRNELREFRGSIHEIWFYEYAGHTIWGATAMIIRALFKPLLEE